MRHASAFIALLLVMGAAAWTVDTIASRSPAPGVVLAWTHTPRALLAGLPAGKVRVVNMWLSGRIIQLHVDSLDAFGRPLAAATLAIRWPGAGSLLAGCG